jgi:hypothetical protein
VGVNLAAPLGLLALLTVPAAVLVWLRFPPPLSRAGARASLALRCAVLLGITLALSGFALQLPASAQTLIVVVDRSASMETALAGEAATVEQLRAGLHSDDRFGIVTFGGDAIVEQPVVTAANSAFSGFSPTATRRTSRERCASPRRSSPATRASTSSSSVTAARTQATP